jgi:hypothetical protein
MSKYKRIETQIKDDGLLQQALEDLSIPFEQGEGLALYGYLGDRRRETAEVVIRRRYVGTSANDLGFHRLDDGTFEAIISEYDQSRRGQRILDQVRQRYAYLAVCQTAQAKGYTVVEQQGDDGVIRLQLKAY